MSGYLVFENEICFKGEWLGGKPRAGEIVFNTSHTGYEEMATDPSYFMQILVLTAPMQGNYGADKKVWESAKLHINGFVALEIQNTNREKSWVQALIDHEIPVLHKLDTRKLVLKLRTMGTTWGAMVKAEDQTEATSLAKKLIRDHQQLDQDWVFLNSRKTIEIREGNNQKGPRIAILDYGCKENIIRESQKRASKVAIFPSRVSVNDIKNFEPHGIILSNGPGDPKEVKVAVDSIQALLGWRPIFGICMGHQLLALALGGSTYKLKFGHRGANHPVEDELLRSIYMTSQNHGYAVDGKSLPDDVTITHTNLYDGTVAGIQCTKKKCFSVQFHPENCPGPHEAVGLFDYFFKNLI